MIRASDCWRNLGKGVTGGYPKPGDRNTLTP